MGCLRRGGGQDEVQGNGDVCWGGWVKEGKREI